MKVENLGILHELPAISSNEFKELLLVQTSEGVEVLYSRSKSVKNWVLFQDEKTEFTNKHPDTTGRGFEAIRIIFEPPILD